MTAQQRGPKTLMTSKRCIFITQVDSHLQEKAGMGMARLATLNCTRYSGAAEVGWDGGEK